MKFRRVKPVKPTNKQVIDAVFQTIMGSYSTRRPGGDFSIKVADLPEDAREFNTYQLDRVALRLGTLGIKVRYMAIHSDTFYFYKQ